MSMPINFWLKPLVKLVAQPSPEKEDQIWWRRKRLYDTLNGFGASELQPNLRTIHFRYPGEQTPVALPSLANLVRQYLGRPAPNPAHYSQPSAGKQRLPQMHGSIPSGEESAFYANNLRQHQSAHPAMTNSYDHLQNSLGSPTTLVESEVPDWQNGWENDPRIPSPMINSPTISQHEAAQYPDLTSQQDQDWLTHSPSQDELMSASEFETLEPHERERVIKEAKSRFEDSNWTNELIKQHTNYIDSLASQQANDEPQVGPIFHRFGKQDAHHPFSDQRKPPAKGGYVYKDDVDESSTAPNYEDEDLSQK